MTHKKTKIVCTIGPATWSPEMLKKLIQAGMNVARLNFSHGSHEEKAKQIKLIRSIAQELGKPVAILADMSGPKLRLGDIDGIKEIKKGDVIYLSVVPRDGELPIQFDLAPHVKKNHRIFLNDGLVELKITDLHQKSIKCQAQNDGWISTHKGVNVPDTHIKGEAFTEKDKDDATFVLKEGIDYLAVSFIQTAEDLKPAKALIKKYSPTTKLVVKVEKNEAVNNLSDIVEATDAVMVARGDLGIEIPTSEVPIVQQQIIRLCRQFQKPVIVATQMLESMTENPRPTRAETSDVANAVLDQVDAVMLSAESASGKYPIEAVSIMKEIILSVEDHPAYNNSILIDWADLSKSDFAYSALADAATRLAERIDAKAIIVPTATGRIARLLSSLRPSAQIVAVTHDPSLSNQLSLLWGVRTVVQKPAGNFDSFLENTLETVREHKFAQKGDKVVVVTGSTVGLSGSTDTIKVVKIEN